MKRVAVVVVVVLLLGIGITGWAWRGLSMRMGTEGSSGLDPDEARTRHRAAFMADLEAIEKIPLLRLRVGDDAGPALNARAPLISQGQELRPIVMRETLSAALDERWLELADDAGVADVDSSLLRGLSRFSRWDLFNNLPPDAAPATSVLDAPLPAWKQLRRLARAHLLKPLAAPPEVVDPVAPPVLDVNCDFNCAAKDVEALARLLSSSTMLAAFMGTLLFEDIADAHALAEQRGRSAGHVVVVDAAMVERLRRALFAAPGFVIGAPEADVDRVLASESLLVCSTVNEAGFHFDLVRPFLDVDDPRPARVAAARARVSALCAAPAPPVDDVDLICRGDPSPSCQRQVTILRTVLRGPSLRAMRSIAAMDYFGRYEAPR
jgi:hypothetical protein